MIQHWWQRRAAWSLRQWIITIASVLLIALGLLTALYQLPTQVRIASDGLGDQPFLVSSEALGQAATDLGTVFPDELDASGNRFRWTRGSTQIQIPALGTNSSYSLALDLVGWPDDVLRSDLRQPFVHVLVNQQVIGVFEAQSQRTIYQLSTPALSQSNLELELRLSDSLQQLPTLDNTATFTGTTLYPSDRRPHGLRLYGVSATSNSVGLNLPAWSLIWRMAVALGLLVLAGWQSVRARWPLFLLSLVLVAFWLNLAYFARHWLQPSFELVLLSVGLQALWNARQLLIDGWLHFRERLSQHFDYGLGFAAIIGLLALSWPPLKQAANTWLPKARMYDPGAIIVVSLAVASLFIVAFYWGDFNRMLDRLNRRLRTRQGLGWAVLGVLVGVWLLYSWSVIRQINYLGNADYSDNGVVARNLVAGRGWVVDYVTQFFRLYPNGSVTRVQETWPMLQPVWIAPFFALFGPEPWAAKIPNLIFFSLLSMLVYHIARQLWDTRVGLIAVLLVLINRHMFRLMIYSTSDLAFVLFYAAAIWLLWRSLVTHSKERLLGSGLIIGLMCWQKTSAVIVAIGMGLWLIWRLWQVDDRWKAYRTAALWWVLPAVLVFAPYIARNLHEFGKPAFSTESYDAWIIGYTNFDSIYNIYTNEQGLPGSNGLPEPSWILRWGYQKTFDKIGNQFEATRNYLLPASPALGMLSGRGNLMGNNDQGVNGKPYVWLMLGAWLSLIGLLAARRQQASLMALVAASFAPYIVFLAFYWHADEERYFVPLVPFLALLAAGALVAIHDAIARCWNQRGRPLALVVAGYLLVLALTPGWVEAANKSATVVGSEYAEWQPDLQAFEWLRQNTPPEAVVMTRVPWQLNFHAERAAVMNPNVADLNVIKQVATYYKASFIVVNAVQNNKDQAQIGLGHLLRGEELAGFKLRASFAGPKNRTVYIYEIQ
ncbi:glycosyltransferase family 39 protein [Herpetosiphon sp. NSE202]|uniref:glycosyltransferase family 39 protein n=1 Tax=Herpetosiphon sp. NSE202 TaxID=3351349 RepID=UPI003633B86C